MSAEIPASPTPAASRWIPTIVLGLVCLWLYLFAPQPYRPDPAGDAAEEVALALCNEARGSAAATAEFCSETGSRQIRGYHYECAVGGQDDPNGTRVAAAVTLYVGNGSSHYFMASAGQESPGGPCSVHRLTLEGPGGAR